MTDEKSSQPGAAPGGEEIVDYPFVHEEAEAPQPLSSRLKDPRTIVSIVLPLVLIVLIGFNLRGLDIQELINTILSANPWYLLAAFAIYYLGFPLRGFRWQRLLRYAGTEISLRDSTEIIFISWLVNCLVPAKLGDVYRAWLLKANYVVSLSRTFGTVFIERIFDLFAIAILGLLAGFWSFRAGLRPEVQLVFGIGIAVLIILSFGLYSIRNFGRRFIIRVPMPRKQQVLDLYDRFEEGVFALKPRNIPLLAVVTALIWGTEAMRLYFVIQAIGFTDVHLGISGAFFVALAASLLTAIPFTPAGLGIVELGVLGILTVIYAINPTDATAIILLDRTISVFSIWVFGGIAYVLSDKTKANRQPVEASVPSN